MLDLKESKEGRQEWNKTNPNQVLTKTQRV